MDESAAAWVTFVSGFRGGIRGPCALGEELPLPGDTRAKSRREGWARETQCRVTHLCPDSHTYTVPCSRARGTLPFAQASGRGGDTALQDPCPANTALQIVPVDVPQVTSISQCHVT